MAREIQQQRPVVNQNKTQHKNDPPGKKMLRNVNFSIDYNVTINQKKEKKDIHVI